jgi:hypothetical protein
MSIDELGNIVDDFVGPYSSNKPWRNIIMIIQFIIVVYFEGWMANRLVKI